MGRVKDLVTPEMMEREEDEAAMRTCEGPVPALFVECPVCAGSGFSTPGTGYGDVCAECGGQRFLPYRGVPMTNPKIAPCPNCKNNEHIGVCTYESGWRRVECDKCHYVGPGEGNAKQAIQSHNASALAKDETP